MKPLLMTCTFKRLDYLRFCILQMKAQDFRDWKWVIMVLSTPDAKRMVGDILDDRIRLIEHKNQHPTQNWKHLINTNYDWVEESDIFLKIDDDDIYKTDYVSKAINWHARNEADVSSLNIDLMVNAGLFQKCHYQSMSQELVRLNDQVGQASSLVLTNKALDIMNDVTFVPSMWADKTWWKAWIEDDNIVISLRENTDSHYLNIHGRNNTTRGLYNKS